MGWALRAWKMGRAAHTGAVDLFDNRHDPRETADDTMMQQIEELLRADAPTLDSLESALTEGYGHALALEAERWRLERRLGEIARAGGDERGDTISAIGEQLNVADLELAKLRELLGTLHARARTARAAS